MAILLMLNVKPYRVHADEVGSPETWLEIFPDDLKQALQQTRLDQECTGKVATKPQIMTVERHFGTVWVTVRVMSGAPYDRQNLW